MVSVADRINEALNARDMKKSDLASASGLTRGSITRYCAGTVIPKRNAIVLMSRALHVQPAWLMGYEDIDMESSIKNVSVLYECLDALDKAKVEAFIEGLLSADKYNKKEEVG